MCDLCMLRVPMCGFECEGICVCMLCIRMCIYVPTIRYVTYT